MRTYGNNEVLGERLSGGARNADEEGSPDILSAQRQAKLELKSPQWKTDFSAQAATVQCGNLRPSLWQSSTVYCCAVVFWERGRVTNMLMHF